MARMTFPSGSSSSLAGIQRIHVFSLASICRVSTTQPWDARLPRQARLRGGTNVSYFTGWLPLQHLLPAPLCELRLPFFLRNLVLHAFRQLG
jgi:hypothetical protein